MHVLREGTGGAQDYGPAQRSDQRQYEHRPIEAEPIGKRAN